jgi:tRNA U34 2-thiouridine synthase MnmA/TrmU
LSGGVDSAVAAWMLKQQGFEVIGVFMKNWEDDDTDEYCTSREDLVDAAAVADVLGIELEAVNFAAEYRERVFATFCASTRRAARRIPTCCATARSSSARFSTTRCVLRRSHCDRPLRARAARR